MLDTNLLLLWLVAETDPRLLEKFKRVEMFTAKDIELLRSILVFYPEMVTTPHILSETSNFVDQAPQPYRERLIESLKGFIRNIVEIFSPANILIEHKKFNHIGLTDTALTELSSTATIITMDFLLSGLIQAAGGNAVNFNQSRTGYLLIKES